MEKQITLSRLILNGFFNNINHKQLLEILEASIQDKHFINLIKKFLKTDISRRSKLFPNKFGTPQGGLISPILGNVYLDVAIDKWFEGVIKTAYAYSTLIRYCDDFIAFFRTKTDAEQFITAVQIRLKEYHLDLELNKTEIYRFNINDVNSQIFNFLGFSISVDMNRHLCFRASYNKALQKVYDISCKFIKQLEQGFSAIDCLHSVNHRLTGLYNYYAVSGNSSWLQLLYDTTADSIKDILYLNPATRQMSLGSLLTLLELCPIVTPPTSFILL